MESDAEKFQILAILLVKSFDNPLMFCYSIRAVVPGVIPSVACDGILQSGRLSIPEVTKTTRTAPSNSL